MKRILSVITAFSLICATAYAEIITPIDTVFYGKEVSDGEIIEIEYYDSEGNLQPKIYTEYALLSDALPEYYRNENVTSVKNQLISGPCWSFAAIGAIETNLIKKGLADTSIDLSEAHMAYFSENPYEEKNQDGVNLGTAAYIQGGNYVKVVSLLSNHQGTAEEKDLPYSSYVKSEQNLNPVDEQYRYAHTAGINTLQNYDPNDIDSIKTAIYTYGAVGGSYYHCLDSSNICKHYNAKNYSYNYPEDVTSNHGILIVGWDDNYSKDNFGVTASQNGAWIVKQCWGDNWGDDGYFYMSYDTPVRTYSVDAYNGTTYDYNYSHTGTSARIYTNGTTIANVFTAQDNEQLEAVSFLVANPGKADIRIFKNIDKYPDDGKLVYYEKDAQIKGNYDTIKLSEPISLNKDDKFSVIITGSTVLLEGNSDTYTAQKGETFHIPFVLDYDGTNAQGNRKSLWTDASDGSCEYLKAFSPNYNSENLIYKNASIYAFTTKTAPDPTESPVPTETPTIEPTESPVPTETPTAEPTESPVPTETPTTEPTESPLPTETPTAEPTETPVPTESPTAEPTETPLPTESPTIEPTETPLPTETPTIEPTETPVPTPSYSLSATVNEEGQLEYANETEETVKFTRYLAIYDENDSLIRIELKEMSIEPHESTTITLPPNEFGEKYCKVFAWGDGQNPLCDMFTNRG